jgi:hypothetical protein
MRELPAGALRPFGTKHIHKVINNAWEPAVSLHVYAPALVEMNAYEVVDGDSLQLTESQLVAAATLQDLGVHRATDVIGGYAAWRESGLLSRTQAARARTGSPGVDSSSE